MTRFPAAHVTLLLLLMAGPAAAWGFQDLFRSRGRGPHQQQLAELRAIADRLGAIEQRLASLEDANEPCTPAAIAEGRCTRADLTTLSAQVCMNLGASAGLGAAYEIDGNTEVELGVGWEEVVDADVHWNVGVPFLLPVTPPIGPIPPVLVPVPDVGLSAEAEGGVELEVCFREVEIPGDDVEDFAERLVAAIENAAPQIRAAARDAAEEHGLLQPERVGNVVAGLRRVGAADVQIGSDGFVFFDQASELRQLADALPIGSNVRGMLDDPEARFATSGQLGDACEVLGATPALTPMTGDVCQVVDNLPDLGTVTQAFELVPDIRSRLFRIESRVDQVHQAVASVVPSPPPPPYGGFDPCSIPIIGRLCP